MIDRVVSHLDELAWSFAGFVLALLVVFALFGVWTYVRTEIAWRRIRRMR